MFTKLASDITFSDIVDFCGQFDEGVRVEYKRQIQHIPKIVSSFANSSGGVFIIGVETDQNNRVKCPIQGIPKTNGIEERILQSALTGIYPAVIPEVIIRDVPDTNNVVVIVRVDESPQAPHAIQNSTRAYIRTGSITQPYELAEIDRIEYMFKRREDSQTAIRQICNRTEERIVSFFSTDEPNITGVVHPIFPYRPIISTGDIYEFVEMNDNSFPFNNWENDFGTRRVGGGVCFMGIGSGQNYWELNEYGIVYYASKLYKTTAKRANEQEEYLHYRQFVSAISELIRGTRSFYEKCGYLGNIEITVRLQQVLGEKLSYGLDDGPSYMEFNSIKRQRCLNSQVSTSAQCLARNLVKKEKVIEVVNGLIGQLLWAFNVDGSTVRGGLIERMLEREF